MPSNLLSAVKNPELAAFGLKDHLLADVAPGNAVVIGFQLYAQI
jgi:hypothetical protein